MGGTRMLGRCAGWLGIVKPVGPTGMTRRSQTAPEVFDRFEKIALMVAAMQQLSSKKSTDWMLTRGAFLPEKFPPLKLLNFAGELDTCLQSERDALLVYLPASLSVQTRLTAHHATYRADEVETHLARSVLCLNAHRNTDDRMLAVDRSLFFVTGKNPSDALQAPTEG